MTAAIPDGLQADLEQLLVERRIEKVLVAYCQGVDRKDWRQVRACYHDDALDSHGQFAGPPDELVTWLRRNHVHVTSSMHVLTNVSMRFSADGRLARVESYCLSLKEVASAADDPFLGASGAGGEGLQDGRLTIYRHVRGSARVGWRILSRHVAFDWVRREPDAVPGAGPELDSLASGSQRSVARPARCS